LARDAQAKLALIVAQCLSIHLCVCPRQLESRVCTQYCASRATSTTGLLAYVLLGKYSDVCSFRERRAVPLGLSKYRPSQCDGIAVLSSTTPHYGSCPSVCLSVCVCPVRATNSETKPRTETKIGVNIPQGRSNGCANVQIKGSKFRVTCSVGGLSHDILCYRPIVVAAPCLLKQHSNFFQISNSL